MTSVVGHYAQTENKPERAVEYRYTDPHAMRIPQASRLLSKNSLILPHDFALSCLISLLFACLFREKKCDFVESNNSVKVKASCYDDHCITSNI